MLRWIKNLFTTESYTTPQERLIELEKSIQIIQRTMLRELGAGGTWKSEKMIQLDGQRKLLEAQLTECLTTL